MGLTIEQRRSWQENGWLRLERALPVSVIERLPAWVDTVAAQPTEDDQRLHYYEQTDAGPVICRTERYLNDHPRLRALICDGIVIETAAALLGEPALLYKEKINYKQPGGAGFAPHQDASAYAHAVQHVTSLVAVDAMTQSNGCLWFARGAFTSLLPDDGDGCLSEHAIEALDWTPVTAEPGDVIYFTSMVPHRSGSNLTGRARRALYLTYNGLSEGDRRERYYADRAISMASSGGGATTRISNIGHFQGRSVADAEPRQESQQ